MAPCRRVRLADAAPSPLVADFARIREQFDVHPEFPDEVEEAARAAAARPLPADGRADLRDLAFFTVDPPGSHGPRPGDAARASGRRRAPRALRHRRRRPLRRSGGRHRGRGVAARRHRVHARPPLPALSARARRGCCEPPRGGGQAGGGLHRRAGRPRNHDLGFRGARARPKPRPARLRPPGRRARGDPARDRRAPHRPRARARCGRSERRRPAGRPGPGLGQRLPAGVGDPPPVGGLERRDLAPRRQRRGGRDAPPPGRPPAHDGRRRPVPGRCAQARRRRPRCELAGGRRATRSSPATCARPTPRGRRSSSRRAASWAARGTPRSRARCPAEHVHAGLATSYAHTTAPLRRLADRYVLDLLVDLEAGRSPSPEAVATLARLPDTMEEAESRAGQVERAIVDDLEARLLEHRVGEEFDAAVVEHDARGARLQIAEPPIRARLHSDRAVRAGDDARRPAPRRRPRRPVAPLRSGVSYPPPPGRRWIALNPRRPVRLIEPAGGPVRTRAYATHCPRGPAGQ